MDEIAQNDIFLDHIAIAVENLDRAQKIFEDIGLKFGAHREKVESQKVETAFASIEKRAHLELVTPLNQEGPIQKFLAGKGEGIHHLCFQVGDVHKVCTLLKDKGYKIIYPEPTVGANNRMVNFIHPSSTGGILVEICSPIK